MTATVVDPRSLTKEKLKSELSNHNITLPSSDSRKDVYVELYRQHILPVVTSSAVGKTRKVDKARLEAFSSDEDDSQDSTKYSPKRMSGQIDPIVPEEVDGLTDDELFMALARRGETVGPIVDSTRRVYQKRLKKQLTEEMEADQEYTNGHEESGPDDDFSDQEEPMETEPLPVYNMPTTRFRLDERPKPFEPIAKRESAATTDARVSTFSTDVPVITHRTSHKFTKFTSDDGRGRQEKVVTHVDEVSEQTLKNIDSQHKQLQGRQSMSLWLQLSIIGVCALVVFLVLTNMEPAYQPPEIGEQ